MTAGKLITLEGGEGTGKSTQACLLADHLRLREIEAVSDARAGWGGVR
jgi:thymidylate kinase